ncbi:hypothetical protein ES702_02493 [subsurface metagenome]
MIKPQARILDATAGNRFIWSIKESPFIIWGDIEPELEFKPDIVFDCTKTDFPDKYFHTIFFDPPHSWGREKNAGIFTTPSKAVSDEKWPTHKRKRPRYYGLDKYKTRTALLGFINRAQKEFYRILRDDGCLWLKWCEIHSTIEAILPIFKNWKEMLTINACPFGSSKNRTVWVMLMKEAC